MQNTYMTPLRYKNFAGVERNTKLHFHLTPREFADWMIDNKDDADKLVEVFSEVQEQIEGNPDAEATTEQKLSMLRLVRILAELSYGKPSDDGEYFDKSDTKKFVHSAAYDAFRMFLFENDKELTSFIETLLNEEVVKEFSTRMEASATEKVSSESATALAQPDTGKNPQDMSYEELVATVLAKKH